MSSPPDYLRRMSRVVAPAPSAEEAESRRARMVAQIQEARGRVEQQVLQRRRQRRWVAVSGMMAAAGIAAALFFSSVASDNAEGQALTDHHAETPSSSQKTDRSSFEKPEKIPNVVASQGASLLAGSLRSVVAGETLSPGDVLSASSFRVGTTRAQIALRSRAEMLVAATSEFRVEQEAGVLDVENVRLVRGRVDLSVPPLESRRLIVTTDEAVVEVRGTAFEVERLKVASGELVTRVAVTEGKVSVRFGDREVFLGPGERWSSGTQEPRVVPDNLALDGGSSAQSATDEAPGREDDAGRDADVSSDLAAQNRLYQSALLASRNGFPELARVRFQELLQKYPHSPLAPGARRELGRLASRKE